MLKFAKCIWFFAACCAFCAHAANNETRPDDYIARAKQFLRAFYPYLDYNLRAVIIDGSRLIESGSVGSDRMNVFDIELHDMDPKPRTSSAPCWCSSPKLSATFLFNWQSVAKELLTMTSGGPILDARTAKFREDMKSHPAWSDTQVSDALKAAGARFGADQKAGLLRVLPLQELKSFTGDLEVVSVEFHLRDIDSEGKRSAVNPYWAVKANWHGPDGQERGCNLTFEPFEGKLLSFYRLP